MQPLKRESRGPSPPPPHISGGWTAQQTALPCAAPHRSRGRLEVGSIDRPRQRASLKCTGRRFAEDPGVRSSPGEHLSRWAFVSKQAFGHRSVESRLTLPGLEALELPHGDILAGPGQEMGLPLPPRPQSWGKLAGPHTSPSASPLQVPVALRRVGQRSETAQPCHQWRLTPSPPAASLDLARWGHGKVAFPSHSKHRSTSSSSEVKPGAP